MPSNMPPIFPVAASAAGEKDLQSGQRETMMTAIAVTLAVLVVALVAVLMGMA